MSYQTIIRDNVASIRLLGFPIAEVELSSARPTRGEIAYACYQQGISPEPDLVASIMRACAEAR